MVRVKDKWRLDHIISDGCLVRAIKRNLLGEELVENDPKGPNVVGEAIGLELKYFWRHVPHSANFFGSCCRL